MDSKRLYRNLILVVAAVVLAGAPVSAQVNVQCPCDLNNDADCVDAGEPAIAAAHDLRCMHLTGGDGFATMGDGTARYMFGFSNHTGTPQANVMQNGLLAANWPAPTIAVDQGQDFYLSLSNPGMVIRPDLFDSHSVHFHGFPQSSTIFDGLPESGIAINQGSTLTYFYHLQEPGTFIYHCHVEATEHMQMGMLGNLYVRADQSWLGYAPNGIPAGDQSECAAPGDQVPGLPCGYAYNDEDGSTAFDREVALQLGGWDPDFHDASWSVQPLPFALMWDRYPMINGRGYPDTIIPGALPSPTTPDPPTSTALVECDGSCNDGVQSQPVSSLIVADAGDRVLLRLSNLNVTDVHTLASPSIPMRVVAIDAKELMTADGLEKLHFTANSVTLGGGMTTDVILDTTGVPAGEYYLYAADVQFLANFTEVADLGGMMTKIIIN
jgi:FtsP/CotA-like multicopper oxidase with cupredoxin domain